MAGEGGGERAEREGDFGGGEGGKGGTLNVGGEVEFVGGSGRRALLGVRHWGRIFFSLYSGPGREREREGAVCVCRCSRGGGDRKVKGGSLRSYLESLESLEVGRYL